MADDYQQIRIKDRKRVHSEMTDAIDAVIAAVAEAVSIKVSKVKGAATPARDRLVAIAKAKYDQDSGFNEDGTLKN